MGIKIIGFCFVKNEDIYIEQVLKNIIDFCDEVTVVDNHSTDNTLSIVKKYMKKYSKIKLEHIDDIRLSQIYIEKFAGQNKWLFGVDGDELYDPIGLKQLRPEILRGKYQKVWMLRGFFFHLMDLDMKNKMGKGYLAPPSKDPNKLYNLSLLRSWKNDNGLSPAYHCQTHVFRNSKYYSGHYPKKQKLYKKFKWDNCPLRCVHTRMLKRSSSENYKNSINPRINISDLIKDKKYNFREKYRIGKKYRKNLEVFFK